MFFTAQQKNKEQANQSSNKEAILFRTIVSWLSLTKGSNVDCHGPGCSLVIRVFLVAETYAANKAWSAAELDLHPLTQLDGSTNFRLQYIYEISMGSIDG
jgi:hypothetical protein